MNQYWKNITEPKTIWKKKRCAPALKPYNALILPPAVVPT
jgi:hypothetical protein